MTEAEWAEGASGHLKAELKRAGITYDGLANLLKRQGFRDETRASVSSKAKERKIYASSLPRLPICNRMRGRPTGRYPSRSLAIKSFSASAKQCPLCAPRAEGQ